MPRREGMRCHLRSQAGQREAPALRGSVVEQRPRARTPSCPRLDKAFSAVTSPASEKRTGYGTDLAREGHKLRVTRS